MKQITFTMTNERGSTTISESFDDDATCALLRAYTFHKFLSSMGYVIHEPDAVGGDVEAYMGSAPSEGDGW